MTQFSCGCTSRIHFEVSDLLSEFRDLKATIVPTAEFISSVELDCLVVPIVKIAPPVRENGELWFRDMCSMDSLVWAMSSGISIPPLIVKSVHKSISFRFSVKDGFHRYYLSLAMRMTHLPVVVDDWEFEE